MKLAHRKKNPSYPLLTPTNDCAIPFASESTQEIPPLGRELREDPLTLRTIITYHRHSVTSPYSFQIRSLLTDCRHRGAIYRPSQFVVVFFKVKNNQKYYA